MLKKLFNRKPKIGGEIAYYNLIEWWASEFTEAERNHIINTFDPLGGSERSLVSGHISKSSQSAIGFLNTLAGWFAKAEDRHIARKIIAKAESLVSSESQTLDVHFLLSQKIQIYYKDRDQPELYDMAMAACIEQISVSPRALSAFKNAYPESPLPSHKGFEQLAVALEKEQRHQEVIELCQKAESQG